ncbi:MAG: hypothetical protein H6812_12185 [Phycisphaeraceae bacterium]|nr:hypothetical protein [Phycisphaeraceae bacterium]
MTRRRKQIIIAIQLAAIAILSIQYLRFQNALAGMLQRQSSSVQEEFDALVAEGLITLNTDRVSPAQRIWHRVFENDDHLADKSHSWWQPAAVLGLIGTLILVSTTRTTDN